MVRAIRELEKIEGILYAGLNFFWHLASANYNEPDDPMLGDQWGLVGPYGIQAPDAMPINLFMH